MGSVMNPMFASLALPGMVGNKQDPTKPPTAGANPILPGTNLSPQSAGSTNPFDVVPTSATATTSTSTQPPAFPANTGPYASSGGGLLPNTGTNAAGQNASDPFGFNKMTPKDQSRLFDSLKKTYGDGMAHMILDFLQSGAGYNQGAINNLLASLQPGIQRGEENIMEQFSAMGNRFGSPAAVGLGDFLSQVNLNEGQLVTQMYEQALNNFMNVMMGTANTDAGRIANSPSGMDSILGALGIGGQAAGGASSIISAIAPGADTGILDAISGALAFA